MNKSLPIFNRKTKLTMKMFHHLTEAISSFLLYIRSKSSKYKDLHNVSYLDDCKKTIYSFNSLSEKI